MSIFKVGLETISQVREHPGADRLELASMKGLSFQFVVLKGKHELGDRVLYFPVDALLPIDVLRALKLEGKLAGRDKNRVKTIKLRGAISQGIVAFPQEILGPGWEQIPEDEITEKLGVSKYEPPLIPCQNGALKPLPDGVSLYDIEGADRFPGIVEKLMDRRVLITEKLEGSNFSITRAPDGAVFVSQRRYTIEPIPGEKEHDFWTVARRQGFFEWVEELGAKNPGKPVTLRGEYLGPGVQKNIYKLEENRVYLFDILIGGDYLGAEALLEALEGRFAAPVLSADKTLGEWLAGRSVQEASNGRSSLADTRREGIVLKPWVEERDEELGRLLIKQRSPDYLAKTDF